MIYMIIFSLAIEFTIMLILSTIFFGMLASVLWFVNHKLMPRTLMWLAGSMVLVQYIGYAIWRLLIENRLVHEADPWVPILTFLPIHFEPISEGLTVTFREPLPPLFTTGQVALLYDGLILLLILIGTLLPTVILAHKDKEKKLPTLVTAFWFLVGQFCWIAVASIIMAFWI